MRKSLRGLLSDLDAALVLLAQREQVVDYVCDFDAGPLLMARLCREHLLSCLRLAKSAKDTQGEWLTAQEHLERRSSPYPVVTAPAVRH